MIPYENLEVTEETLGTGTVWCFIKGVYLGTKFAIKKIKLDEDMKLMDTPRGSDHEVSLY